MSERHNQNGSSRDEDRFPEELLTAYALGQLEGAERGEIERMLANPAQSSAREQVGEIQRLAAELQPALSATDGDAAPLPALREAVAARLKHQETAESPLPIVERRRFSDSTWVRWALAGGVACLLVVLSVPVIQWSQNIARRTEQPAPSDLRIMRQPMPTDDPSSSSAVTESRPFVTSVVPVLDSQASEGQTWYDKQGQAEGERSMASVATDPRTVPAPTGLEEIGAQTALHNDLAGKPGGPRGTGSDGNDEGFDLSTVGVGGGRPGERTQAAGQGQPELSDPYIAPATQNNGKSDYQKYYESSKGTASQPKSGDAIIAMQVTPRIIVREEKEERLPAVTELARNEDQTAVQRGGLSIRGHSLLGDLYGAEQYESIYENVFLAPRQNPLSTFSIDVDTASYANMRRFLTGGSLPPADAVRIEELLNYFRYDYPQPMGPEPFSVNMEVAECPWNTGHLLLRVGLKGKEVHRGERPASNLVFLLDVSGSMADENKLPLLKTAMQMFAAELGENDRVSIVTYAGEAGLRLPPTRGHEYEKIRTAIESLSSGGSTNGSAGIELAYEQAKAYFVEGGTNRVILCTDGDLNVGVTDDEALVQLIKQKAAGGTFLTVLGFGEGNLKDAKMEKLADNGNGLYAYIDSVREARKVLVEQMTGSTITIAKDVKIQIEFNPAVIASYRLLGYENRVLAAQDFNDDKKDAGEIGAGHTVTALYELVPVGAKADAALPAGVEPLKYQAAGGQKSEVRGKEDAPLTDAAKSGELLTLKLRYKEPDGQTSKLLEVPLKERGGKFNAASKDLQFAAAVASFGMILRGSEHKGGSNIAAVEEIASGAIGEDAGGYRAEFVDLVRKAHTLGAR